MTLSSLERSPKESLSLYLGLGKSRKTTLALEDGTGEHIPHDGSWRPGPKTGDLVVVTSEITHDALIPFPYIEDTASSFLQKALRADKERRQLLILMIQDNPEVFDFLIQTNKTILLDDAAFLNAEPDLKKPLKKFIRHIRHRKKRVLITTHRAVDDLPPIAYFYATRIHQIGGLQDEGEARLLFKRRTLNVDFAEFYQKLKNQEVYDNTQGNYEKSVYTIKSL